MKNLDLDHIWREVLKNLKDNISSSGLRAWVKPATLSKIDNDIATIEVRNEFNRNLLVQNYNRQIAQSLQKITDNPSLKVQIIVNTELPSSENYTPSLFDVSSTTQSIQTTSTTDTSLNKVSPHSALPSNLHENIQVVNNVESGMTLNTKFTFETFVVGIHNQFCHAAALSIAQAPLQNPYNPLFIYGGVGLGKTHIMQAIGNYVHKHKPNCKVTYITTEKFLNDLIESMKQGKMSSFRAKYRGVGILLIDDIQFIEGKESTQQEFFHTFNALRDQGSQIVLSSDRPPKAINRLEPRLCSRFEGGLVADVQAPTFETRLAILEQKAEELNIALDPHISQRIAESYPDNIRSLEGALTKIAAYNNLTSHSLSLDVVNNILQLKKSEESLMDRMVHAVTYEMNLNKDDIVGPSRSKKFVQARQIIVYIARNLGISWTEIGNGLGGRGNSSLISLHRNISDSIHKNKFEYSDVLNKVFDTFNKK